MGAHAFFTAYVIDTAGFKLDTLLKLADVKGTDRKTSFLHFVLDQLLKESSAMHSLPHQLSDVKAAANLQVSFSTSPFNICFDHVSARGGT